jgi:outer membrane lipoprotein carrier protein
MSFSISLFSNELLNIKSFQGDFVQTIVNSSGNTIEYEGELLVKNSNKIVWHYTKPIIKNVYILDNYAIVDEPELEQAIYTQLQKELNLLTLLKQAKQTNENSYETTVNDIKYNISMNNHHIQSITYKDELENSVTIAFKNTQINHAIKEERFQFLAPEHYDIIRK